MSTVTWLNQYGDLSTLLIPLTLILYIFVQPLRPVFFKAMVAIGLIGIIELVIGLCINRYKKINKLSKSIKISPVFLWIGALIAHIIILFVLIDFSKYWQFNKFSFLLLIVANLIIIFLPWWPYIMSKPILLIVYNGIYLAIFGIGYLINYSNL